MKNTAKGRKSIVDQSVEELQNISYNFFCLYFFRNINAFLAMITHSAVQPSTQTAIHSAILFIDTSTMRDTTKLIR